MASKDWDDNTITTGDTVIATQWVDMANEIQVNTAKTGVTDEISNVSEDTTPQLGGNLDLNGKGVVVASQTIDGGVSTGNLVYLDTTSWKQADADAEATSIGQLGISLGSNNVLIDGIYTTTGLTAGSDYYISTTAGGITTTKPSTTGDIVRFIGTALSTTQLLFKPSQNTLELA